MHSLAPVILGYRDGTVSAGTGCAVTGGDMRSVDSGEPSCVPRRGHGDGRRFRGMGPVASSESGGGYTDRKLQELNLEVRAQRGDSRGRCHLLLGHGWAARVALLGQPGETGMLPFPGDCPASRCPGAHALRNLPSTWGCPARCLRPTRSSRVTLTAEAASPEPGSPTRAAWDTPLRDPAPCRGKPTGHM